MLVFTHMSACRITVHFRDNRYFSVCFVLVLFHRGPAKILVVNTRIRHLKPLQFIGLVSADTAWLSKSSVCAHKHWSFWRHGNAYRADTPHLPRMRGWKELYLSFSLFLSASRSFFSSCLSFPASPTPQYFMPFRDYLVFLFFHSGKPHQAGICEQSCHSESFSCVFTNSIWH